MLSVCCCCSSCPGVEEEEGSRDLVEKRAESSVQIRSRALPRNEELMGRRSALDVLNQLESNAWRLHSPPPFLSTTQSRLYCRFTSFHGADGWLFPSSSCLLALRPRKLRPQSSFSFHPTLRVIYAAQVKNMGNRWSVPCHWQKGCFRITIIAPLKVTL